MKRMNLTEIARAINCLEMVNPSIEGDFNSISTDTRHIKPQDVFLALKGEHFDAHNFLHQAVERGASALIVSRRDFNRDIKIPVLVVRDTLEALQSLANYNRLQFEIPVIGITGSNGKTTTKDMVAAVLSHRFSTLKTSGNFNNEIGLPLTLLQLDETYQAAVIEMGMRGLGQIDLLGKIARPNVGVITSIGETHLEILGSIENIALAKSEILNHLDKSGFAVFNGEDTWVKKIAEEFTGEKIFYGFNQNFYCWAEDIKTKNEEGQSFKVHIGGKSAELFIPILGKHNILNAMVGIVIGVKLGLSLEEIAVGLRNLKLTSMRLEVIENNGVKYINDAYNANPASVKASLQILKEMGKGKRTIAVLGDMYELGERTEAGHKEVGEAVANETIDILIGVGKLANFIVEGAKEAGFPQERLFYAESKEAAKEKIEALVQKNDLILVKGSRGMKMEELIQGRY